MTEHDDALLEQILVSVRVIEKMAGEIKELVSGRIDDRIAICPRHRRTAGDRLRNEPTSHTDRP